MALFDKFFGTQTNTQNKVSEENVTRVSTMRLSEDDIYSLTTFPYNFTEDFNLPLTTAQKVYIKKEIFKWYAIYFKIHSIDVINQLKSRISDEVCLAYYKTHPEEYRLMVSHVISRHMDELLENLFKDYSDEKLINWQPVLYKGLWHPNQGEYSDFVMKSMDIIEFFLKEEINLQKEDLEQLIKINESYGLTDEEKEAERLFLIKTYLEFYKEEILKNTIQRLLMEYYNYSKYEKLNDVFDNHIYIEYHTAFNCNNYNQLFKGIHKTLKNFFKTNSNEDLLDWFKENNDEFIGFIMDYISNLSETEQKKLTYKDLSKYALSLDSYIIALFKINLDGFGENE